MLFVIVKTIASVAKSELGSKKTVPNEGLRNPMNFRNHNVNLEKSYISQQKGRFNL